MSNGIKFANPEDEDRFTVGHTWHSHDLKTWIEGECTRTVVPQSSPVVTISAVDEDRGVVEVELRDLTPAP